MYIRDETANYGRGMVLELRLNLDGSLSISRYDESHNFIGIREYEVHSKEYAEYIRYLND